LKIDQWANAEPGRPRSAPQLRALHDGDKGVLCDLDIEGERDGYTVIAFMRKINLCCLAIAIKGHPDEESEAQDLRLGIDDYIVKPTRADILVAILADKLSAQSDLPSQQVKQCKIQAELRIRFLDHEASEFCWLIFLTHGSRGIEEVTAESSRFVTPSLSAPS
jgi:DNA-binding response OmpR family regulator